MLNYKDWYGVNGIFFDEMSNLGTMRSYYSNLAAYARSLNFEVTVGNPGTTVDASLVGIFSNLCIYESPGMPSISNIDSYSSSYGKHGFSYISYGVGSLPSPGKVQSTANYVSYIYITSLAGSNPFNGLPSLFFKGSSHAGRLIFVLCRSRSEFPASAKTPDDMQIKWDSKDFDRCKCDLGTQVLLNEVLTGIS